MGCSVVCIKRVLVVKIHVSSWSHSTFYNTLSNHSHDTTTTFNNPQPLTMGGDSQILTAPPKCLTALYHSEHAQVLLIVIHPQQPSATPILKEMPVAPK